MTIRPDRALCTGCGATHVVLDAGLLPRRAYAAALTGQALAASARGHGHRPIAVGLAVPAGTVRGWIRAARRPAVQLRVTGIRAVLAPGHDELPSWTRTGELGAALEHLAAAALVLGRRPVYITAGPWPGIPIRKGNRKTKAADIAEGTWPNLLGKFKPHDDRHSHSTWLDESSVSKVLQMERRGHAVPGMDAVYVHPTPEMRRQLCDYLQRLWQQGIAERYELAPRSAVPLLDEILIAHEKTPKREHADTARTPEVLTRARREQASQARRSQSRG